MTRLLSNMRIQTRLRRLSLARTGIHTASLALELAFMVFRLLRACVSLLISQRLEYIDISDNKIDKQAMETIIMLLSSTQTLNTQVSPSFLHGSHSDFESATLGSLAHLSPRYSLPQRTMPKSSNFILICHGSFYCLPQLSSRVETIWAPEMCQILKHLSLPVIGY